MRQIYNADSPLFWEEVLHKDSPSGGVEVAGAQREGEEQGEEEEPLNPDPNQNHCLSVCTFASRLVLNNLLPSRLAT